MASLPLAMTGEVSREAGEGAYYAGTGNTGLASAKASG